MHIRKGNEQACKAARRGRARLEKCKLETAVLSSQHLEEQSIELAIQAKADRLITDQVDPKLDNWEPEHPVYR